MSALLLFHRSLVVVEDDYSLDAVVLRNNTSGASLNSFFLAVRQSDFSSRAVVQATLDSSWTASGVVLRASSFQTAIDAVLGFAKLPDIDSYLSVAQLRTNVHSSQLTNMVKASNLASSITVTYLDSSVTARTLETTVYD